MKYLKKFATQAEYDAYVSGGMETPNVSLVEETYTTFFTKKVVEEPEVIEYQFDCRDVPWERNEMMWMYTKTLYGDFSELYDSVIDCIKTYGTNQYDNIWSLGEYGSETPLENLKISAITDDPTTGEEKVCHLCWIETEIDGGYINWGFNNVYRSGNNMGGECTLERNCFTLCEGLNEH